MVKITLELEAEVDPEIEDDGQAQIAEIDRGGSAGEDSFFVRLHSWSDNKNHPVMDALKGKRVRVTIEVID